MEATPHQISRLLTDWSNGNQRALDQLMPLVYEELRRMARNYLRQQPANHSFQTTELIHEAYLKLAKNNNQNWQNKEHFFGVAAKAMRHILVDYARSKQSQKHGGGQQIRSLDGEMASSDERSGQLVALDDALKDLELLDERKAQVVELRFFGGLTTEEVADVLKISRETVKRDWRFARTWLLRELSAAG
ncbi:MAG TPA: sigma-70 family RNA polymerase sigma factor [Pyrinomonadaceae bacterium]|nr:sigma-70 family RNA polymerase sigma factor [Pyrinomonadaceae bacterium]